MDTAITLFFDYLKCVTCDLLVLKIIFYLKFPKARDNSFFVNVIYDANKRCFHLNFNFV